ncbi:MAG: amidohydrolase family protein [Candidatus Binatus sp.]|uniref:amidohydrolase family protein n=1 Tax=Candidatus Binatus sp. TaxID=2811406 RepID=UPI002726F551|nr:amidohydrolase family protein [Candidatus Binatus sp.]MDO8433439.1 amidohydrolase family protein [Candidatus Binatus sp.]
MANSNGRSKSAEIRSRLDHPIVDADGHHTVEFTPGFLDYLKDVGGARVVDRFTGGANTSYYQGWYALSPEERRDRRFFRPPWWAVPTKNTLDRATATLPRLMYERLDEIGLDFAILYPTQGMFAPHINDEEVRRAACRAFNRFNSDVFREYSYRLTPAAVIPMHNPQEAIEELEYAVKELKMKAVMMASYVIRPIAAVVREHPKMGRYARWIDTFGLDSEHDYDPLWAKCVELKVPATFHSPAIGLFGRDSISNYMFNHIGHFAAISDRLCKSLFMGGVTRRFPSLKFAFLECGVGWACSLYADLLGHWDKRNIRAMENYDPANLDREMLLALYEQYGDERVRRNLDSMRANPSVAGTGREYPAADQTMLDEWQLSGVDCPEDLRDRFVPNFYFGCEADDPITASAFDARRNPLGARLNAIFSSDMGHWDVPDMTKVVEEAHEMVEHETIGADDFRRFVFENPVRLWAEANPDFFKGTIIEGQVARLIGKSGQSGAR